MIAHISSSSALIPLLFGLFRWKWLHGNLKLILWLEILSVVADAISLLLVNNGINTWPIINLFLIIQFTLLFLAFKFQRKAFVLRMFFLCCFIFALFNYLFLQTPKTFNTFTFYACAILMIISALSFLYRLMIEMPEEGVHRLAMFWLAFGVLVYYGGTLFLFLFNNYLAAHLPKSYSTIWILHNVLNITKNVFLFMAIWMNYKSRAYQS